MKPYIGFDLSVGFWVVPDLGVRNVSVCSEGRRSALVCTYYMCSVRLLDRYYLKRAVMPRVGRKRYFQEVLKSHQPTRMEIKSSPKHEKYLCPEIGQGKSQGNGFEEAHIKKKIIIIIVR